MLKKSFLWMLAAVALTLAGVVAAGATVIAIMIDRVWTFSERVWRRLERRQRFREHLARNLQLEMAAQEEERLLDEEARLRFLPQEVRNWILVQLEEHFLPTRTHWLCLPRL